MTVFRSGVSGWSIGWLAVAVAMALLIAAWVIMLRDGWTVVSAVAVIASSWIVACVYLAQESRRARQGVSRAENLTPQ